MRSSMLSHRPLLLTAAVAILLALSPSIAAQRVRVNVVLENLAPNAATFQTPIWVGFHDGSFDTYDGGTLANTLPIPGSDALERLAEDGSTGPLMRDFATLGAGLFDATLPGPNGPIAPGERAVGSFVLNPNEQRNQYFSYASMVIPSNDAFIANGNPRAHRIFDASGSFIGRDFFVAGPNAVNDAGTEANDEIPANTAFFGQMAPNTGVTEANPIIAHPGFLSPGSGGILDAARFRDADFTLAGYPFLRVGFRAAPAITDQRIYSALALGVFEVPAVATPALAVAGAALVDSGERLVVAVQILGLTDLTMAHLHLGPIGSNGPVVADLIGNAQAGSTPNERFVIAEIRSESLVGPLADFPLDELVRRIEAGEIYVNLHSTAFPSGELRGQLARL